MKLNGQVALITGASSGIGESLARALALNGARLVLVARREERLKALQAELTQAGAQVLVHPADVTRDGEIEAAVRAAVTTFGSLDIVIANAGFGVVGAFESLKLEDFRRQFETNVYGVIRTVQASLPALKQSRGRLVLLGSVAGHVALPGAAPYAMSKFAVHALAASLGGELKRDGVSVTLISPGFISSEIRQVDNQGLLHSGATDPMPKWLLMPSDVAARKIVAAIAARKREAVITAHGKLIVFVQRHFPWVFAWIGSRGVRGRPEPGKE